MGYKNHSAVARAEAGSVDLSQSRVAQFAQVLDVTPAYLMGWVSKEDSIKNDQLAKLIVKMRVDNDFYNMIADLAELDEDKYQSIRQLVATLKK
jgi:succinate dehydrogenase flavin-adding protein (antitoxin of CptAB toxin-antitoxin module)